MYHLSQATPFGLASIVPRHMTGGAVRRPNPGRQTMMTASRLRCIPTPKRPCYILLSETARGRPQHTASDFQGQQGLLLQTPIVQQCLCCSCSIELGVKKGDRVAILHAQLPAIRHRRAWSAGRLVGSSWSINPLYTEPELEHAVGDAAPRQSSC